MATDDTTNLLIIVLDTNPVWWGQNEPAARKQITISQFIDAVMVFANSHVMMSQKHKLAVIAAHLDTSHFLYPKSEEDTNDVEAVDDKVQRGELDGKYELHAQIDDAIKDEMKQLMLNETGAELHNDSIMAGAMSCALCYINRCENELPIGEKLVSRILAIKCSEDNPAQYMNMMNVIFAAQKLNVLIDACVLDNDSGLLQQACDITHGFYFKVPQHQGLLQYLLWIFLPSGEARKKISLPAKTPIDYRAACFCHRQLIDIGYVCSVCLSIFCSFTPVCTTCHTTFKITAPPKASKKRKKPMS